MRQPTLLNNIENETARANLEFRVFRIFSFSNLELTYLTLIITSFSICQFQPTFESLDDRAISVSLHAVRYSSPASRPALLFLKSSALAMMFLNLLVSRLFFRFRVHAFVIRKFICDSNHNLGLWSASCVAPAFDFFFFVN